MRRLFCNGAVHTISNGRAVLRGGRSAFTTSTGLLETATVESTVHAEPPTNNSREPLTVIEVA